MSEDIREIMEEQPGGPTFGRKAGSNYSGPEGADERTQRSLPLDAQTRTALDLMAPQDEMPGFSIVGPDVPFADGGMVAHRGATHPDEYIDEDILRAAAEEALGFSYGDVASAYQEGRPTAAARQLRERIDSRLLALSREGGNMAALARALPISEKTIDRALARAKRVEVAPIIKRPAVVSRRICFKCEAEGARSRRRRHSTSPDQWIGTVDLCDKCYTQGFDTRPGNPRYWEHRLATRPIGA